ncbi:MAG: DUF3048 C-terminal domain-containing protein, partial [Patescibacteria group bacterium]
GDKPLYGHVGGANTPGPANALGEIRDLGWENYNDMNQFGVPFPFYYRDYERLPNRVTEHTMYSSTFKLWDYADKQRELTNIDEKKVSWTKGFKPWKFKDDAGLAERGTVNTIKFGFWEKFDAGNYNVTWKYNKEANAYVRANGNTPHIDKNSSKALVTKNVVVVFVDESPANDGYEGGHLLYDVVGQGDGVVFQNGKAAKIKWKKGSEKQQMVFTDSSGREVSLVRGQVFVEVLPTGNNVAY